MSFGEPDKQSKKKKSGGFSIIEVAIATGIVSFAFVGLMSVFAYNYRVAIMNRNRIIAAYLAQEVLESVKQKRDTNWFRGDEWDNGIPTGSDLVMRVVQRHNMTQGWVIAAGSPDVYLHDGTYIQTVGLIPSDMKKTSFSRSIKIEQEPVADPTWMKITVTVTANGSDVEVVSYLYNDWYK